MANLQRGLVVVLAVYAVGCGNSATGRAGSSTDAGTSTVGPITASASLEAAEPATPPPDMSSRPTAPPPLTSVPTTVQDGDGTPMEGATLTASATSVRVGDEIMVTVHCPFSDGVASLYFDEFAANHLYVDAPRSPDDDTLYETALIVPYYLSVGAHDLRAGCVEMVAEPEPFTIEVLPSLDGYSELWRPIQHPWYQPDRPAGAPPPPPVDDMSVTSDGTLPIHALCDSNIPRSGAKFIAWAPQPMGSDDFVSVEFPVADTGYDIIDDGVVISADITFAGNILDSSNPNIGSPTRISALCRDTATPFTIETEPELPRLLVNT